MPHWFRMLRVIKGFSGRYAGEMAKGIQGQMIQRQQKMKIDLLNFLNK